MTSSSLRPWLAIGALLLLCAFLLVGGGPGSAADRQLLLVAQQAALVPAARMVTDLGSWAAVLVAAAIGALWLLVRRRFREAAILIVLMVSQRPPVELLKEGFDRARPDPQGHLVAVQSMAFPSGHAANAITLALGIALLVAHGRARGPALALGLLFALLVGLSRLVLGVHWPSDVAGGWALGAAWTLLLLRIGQGTTASRDNCSPKESDMTDRTDRGPDRAETARRTDDSDIIDKMEDAPAFGGSHDGNLQRDIGARDEAKEEVGDGDGVTRVRDSDEPEQTDLPRFNP